MHIDQPRPRSNRECLLAASILAAIVLFPAPASSQDADAETLFKQAETANQAGALTRAIDLYTTLVLKYPSATAAHVNLGVALAHAGRMDDAATQYAQALTLDPGNSAIGIDFAILRYKQANYAEAARLLEPVVKAHPEKGQPLFLLADCYMHLGTFRDAIALLEPIYAKDPTDRTVSYLLGRSLLAAGDVEKGSVVIDRVFRDADSAEASLLIGARLLSAGDSHAAAPALRIRAPRYSLRGSIKESITCSTSAGVKGLGRNLAESGGNSPNRAAC